MKKHPTRELLFGMSELDLWHHAVLVLMLVASFFVFLFFSYSKPLQFFVGFMTALLYVGWGAVHHYYDGDLYVKTMVEYILIALLGLVVLAGILL